MKNVSLLLLLAGNLFTLSAQSLSDSIVANFHLLEQIPQEKLYLHLDKPYYSAGEKLWFKGYLVNATTHQATPNQYILAELINQSDSVIERKKIRRDTLNHFANRFDLPASLPAGNYYVRAYSDYMRNGSPEFFFTHDVKIGNAIDNAITSTIHYVEKEGHQYAAEIRFLDEQQKPLTGIDMRYHYTVGSDQTKHGRVTTNKEGTVNIPVGNLAIPSKRRLDIEFDDLIYVCKRTFYPPVNTHQFDVTFFPEGGALLALRQQRIAFKAQGEDGYAKAISGTVLTAAQDTLLRFRSEHDGMGLFTLPTPQPGATYYVEATSAEGITKRFTLPPVETKGVSLSLAYSKRAIHYQVQQTDSTAWQPLLLVGHTRGKLSILHPIEKENVQGIILPEQLQSGIAHFMLVDPRGGVLSERLLFIPEQTAHQYTLATDKPHYGMREKVTLQLWLKDSQNRPVSGDFSIAVTNRAKVQPDSLADNICSNLLLTSDLKGTIENPGYYFLNQEAKTLHHLDLVMMTHGWRRHHITNVTRITPPALRYYMEEGQIISGHVEGLWGNDVKGGIVSLINPINRAVLRDTTDAHGRFLFSTVFRDSATYMVHATTRKGSRKIGIEMDKPVFPQAMHKGPYGKEHLFGRMHDYLSAAREQYFQQGGERIYHLKEVLVTARRRAASNRSIYEGTSHIMPSITAQEIERLGASSAFDALTRRMPNISIHSVGDIDQAIFYRRKGPAYVIINDLVYRPSEAFVALETLRAEDIETMTMLSDFDRLKLSSRGVDAAISIRLKPTATHRPKEPVGFILYRPPMGFSDQVEFYSPTYATPAQRNSGKLDNRTTLYWNPAVRLDAEGKTTLTYYMPDNDQPQTVVVEGIDTGGRACRITHTINR
ncbi:MAG: TonB-dependent receptor [Prevotellaceae bacterium]|nr:TonB-dependent receptor [Prevotellaceae bacterium]